MTGNVAPSIDACKELSRKNEWRRFMGQLSFANLALQPDTAYLLLAPLTPLMLHFVCEMLRDLFC